MILVKQTLPSGLKESHISPSANNVLFLPTISSDSLYSSERGGKFFFNETRLKIIQLTSTSVANIPRDTRRAT